MGSPSERIEPAILKAEAFSHLTEDEGIVRDIFLGLFPGESSGIREEILYGHYKNRIIKLAYSTESRPAIEGFLARALPSLIPEIEDNKRAYFRFSKNRLISGELLPAEGGEQAVSVEVSFRVFGGADLGNFLISRAGELGRSGK